MLSGREDTLEERYAIKFCFKLGKNASETRVMLQTVLGHFASIEHQFLSGIRDSRKAGSLWGVMRGVGEVRKPIHQSWLAKGFGLGLLCWGFKGVQEEIPSEEATLVTDYLTKMGINTVPQPSYSPDLAPCDFWSFLKIKEKLRGCRYETIEEMKEAVTKVIDTHTQEDFHGTFQKLLEQYNKCIAAGEDYFEGD